MSRENQEKPRNKLVFTSRLAPKADDGSTTDDVGIQLSSELEARPPVIIAAGRTHFM